MTGAVFVGVNDSRPVNITQGTTRWNQSSNTMEVWDGVGWQTISTGEVRNITLEEMVQGYEDEMATTIEEQYADNATILDAFAEWEKANERFKVVLALAEKK